jgi:hypothetical protein
MDQLELEKAVTSILEASIYKTAAQVAEELKMEHPQLWRQLEKEGEMLYGCSCTTVQQPYTRISQILLSLPDSYRHYRNHGKEILWGLPGPI